MLFNGRKQKRKLARSAFETEINDDTYTAEKGSKSNNKYKKNYIHNNFRHTAKAHWQKAAENCSLCKHCPSRLEKPPLGSKTICSGRTVSSHF